MASWDHHDLKSLPYDGGGERPGIPELPRAPENILGNILAARAKTHGDYGHHAGCTGDIKRAIQRWRAAADNPPLADMQQESLDMIAHKIGRIVAGDPNVEDHWRDIAGYATLVADRLKAV